MLKIDNEKMKEYGYSFETMEDLFSYIKEEIEWLESQPNGKEEVIKRNLTEKEAIEYFENIENTYYREQKA